MVASMLAAGSGWFARGDPAPGAVDALIPGRVRVMAPPRKHSAELRERAVHPSSDSSPSGTPLAHAIEFVRGGTASDIGLELCVAAVLLMLAAGLLHYVDRTARDRATLAVV